MANPNIIKWHRCTIDKKDLKQLSTPNDFQGFIYTFGHLTIWLIAGTLSFYYFVYSNWIGFIIFLFIQGTVASFFNAAHHELHHGTVFKTKQLNNLFLDVFGILGWLDPITYSLSHTFHHKNTLHNQVDFEEVHPKIPSLNILYLIQLFSFNFTGGEKSAGVIPTVKSFVKIALGDLSNPFQGWDHRLYSKSPDKSIKATMWARKVIIFHIFVAIISFLLNQPILILIITGTRFIGGWLFYFASSPQHCGLKTDSTDFRKSVRSITLDPFTEFIYWNMNWHLEHHMYTSVPCYNLKKLHRLIAEQCPKPKTLLGAWIEMRTIYSKQLKDPSYEYDTIIASNS